MYVMSRTVLASRHTYSLGDIKFICPKGVFDVCDSYIKPVQIDSVTPSSPFQAHFAGRILQPDPWDTR